jgi:serralysin
LDGGSGDDDLDGGSGADTMRGGDGSDTYSVDDAGDRVVETNADAGIGGTDTVDFDLASYTLPDHVENGRVLASGVANLTGNSLDNVLYAGTGDNILDGGAGSDTVTWHWNHGSLYGGITASLATGLVTGGSGTDTLIGIEHLIGSYDRDHLTGDGNANRLDGGSGWDTLVGGDGNDVYVVDQRSDEVVETNADPSSGGIDLVQSSVRDWVGSQYFFPYVLPANVENAVVVVGYVDSGYSFDLAGNSLANTLTGDANRNRLDGRSGADTMAVAMTRHLLRR